MKQQIRSPINISVAPEIPTGPEGKGKGTGEMTEEKGGWGNATPA